MDAELKNARFVQPTVAVVTMFAKSSPALIPRGADIMALDAVDATEVELTRAPLHKSLVEVYLDGFRVVNPSFDFGATHQDFEIVGKKIIFRKPQTGALRIIVDYQVNGPQEIPENKVIVRNSQGARTKAVNPGDLYASYFCTPMVLTLPHDGYVRVSHDGCSLVYYPNRAFKGNDSFSYTVITERGQIAEPKCVNIKVG